MGFWSEFEFAFGGTGDFMGDGGIDVMAGAMAGATGVQVIGHALVLTLGVDVDAVVEIDADRDSTPPVS